MIFLKLLFFLAEVEVEMEYLYYCPLRIKPLKNLSQTPEKAHQSGAL